MGESRQTRVVRKCHELREQGKSWGEIAAVLPLLGVDYLRKTGEPYKAKTLMSMYSNNKNKILSDYERDENGAADGLNAVVSRIVQEALDRRLPEMKEALAVRVKEMVREEMSRHVVGGTGARSATKPELYDIPPEPKETKKQEGAKGKGRSKQDRRYVRKTLTIDTNLWNLFEQDMKAAGISSAGRMADTILWNHYGKPALSYMTESGEPQSGEGQDPTHGSAEE